MQVIFSDGTIAPPPSTPTPAYKDFDTPGWWGRKYVGPYRVNFIHRDSPNEVHFIRKESPCGVHFIHRDSPYR